MSSPRLPFQFIVCYHQSPTLERTRANQARYHNLYEYKDRIDATHLVLFTMRNFFGGDLATTINNNHEDKFRNVPYREGLYKG